MLTPATQLLSRGDRADARRLIESHGLLFEDGGDDLVGVHDDGRLVATACRAGFVFKMFAIDLDYQGGGLLGELLTELTRLGRGAGHDVFWVFTRPDGVASFTPFHFRLLATSGRAALLEHGGGFERWWEERASLVRPGRNGACVINGNPFTLGHLYLVEQAARRVDTLFLFVVREDRSVFPFEVRRRLAERAVAHIPDVVVTDTSRYAVSAGTFPSYFLKRLDVAALEQMRLDLQLFAQQIAPRFQIRARFVGREPFDPTTAAYNEVMREVLPVHGIELVELRRSCGAGEEADAYISATKVRGALARGDLEAIRGWVPPSTFEFLASAEGQAIADRLKAQATLPPV